MVQVIDFGKSVSSTFSQSASITVLSLPNSSILGQFGCAVSAGGSVQLEATLGLQNSTGATPDVIFTIIRNAIEVFTVRSSQNASDNYQAINFSFVDTNIPAGYYAYALTVSAVTSGNSPHVVGPIVFTGLSVV